MSPLVSPVSREGAMADNSTHPIVDILESFGLSKIFCHLYTLDTWKLTYNVTLSTLYFFKNSGECRKAVSSLLGELIFQQKCRQS